MDTNRFIELLEAYLQNKADEDAQQELFLLIASGKYDAQIQSMIEVALHQDAHTEMDAAKANQIREYILTKPGVVVDRPQADDATTRPTRLRGVSRSGPRVIRRWKWVAAACIIIALAVVGILTNNHKVKPPEVATTHDVPAPTETRAVITLANGTKVYLDSVNTGTIARESNVNVVKTEDGKLIYNANGEQRTANSLAYNTLTNPRGSKVIDMTLSDGSHVWLNSGSSIKYPVAFIGKERIVEITGEAYFEVAKQVKGGRLKVKGEEEERVPFVVKHGDVSVNVLGTHFNVNAYDDEESLKVTLLEGSVKVSNKAGSVKIKPGQQAAVTFNLQPLTFNNVNLDAVMSWKNGKFSYSNTDLPTIMRQMARWYDVEVIYQDPIKDRYTVDIPRTVPVSQLFKFIEMSGGVHFKIEGKKITVSK